MLLLKIIRLQSSKDQNKSSSNKFYGQEKYKENGKGGRNLKEPDTNSSGLFRNGVPLIQCYNCGGWGHRAFKCPSPLNYQQEEPPNKKKGTKSPVEKTTSAVQDQPGQSTERNQKYNLSMIIIITQIQ